MLIEARALPWPRMIGKLLHRVIVGRVARRDVVRDVDLRQARERIVDRFAALAVCGSSARSTFGGAGCDGIEPKYFFTFARASSGSKSPTSVSTALLGA